MSARRNRLVLRNSALSVVQVAVNGGLYLVLYRFLLDTIGVAQLGVWAIVLAWTSVNNVASLGLGGSTTYFIPTYLARGERRYVAALVQTGTLTAAGSLALGLLVFYPFVRTLLGLVIDDPALMPLALSIVPYAFASVWLSATAGIVYASLDGFQRVDQRQMVLVAGGLVLLVGAFVLVPTYGLVGLAQAQLAQAATVLLLSWGLLRRLLPELPLVPWQWSQPAFREMIGYSLRYQVISIALMLLEPVAKSLIAAFGSVSAVGYFEMANRLALQLRAFVVNAHTALVPTLTDLREHAPERLREIYETSCRLVAVLLLVSLPLLVALVPFVSVVWVGRYEPTFVVFASLLFVGWFGNLVGNPAYVDDLGAGRLRWIVREHVLMAVLNVLLGVALGSIFGGTGVVIGFVTALLAGSLLLAVAYHRSQGVPAAVWVSADHARLAAGASVGMAAVLGLFYTDALPLGVPARLALALAAYALAIAGPLWHHAALRETVRWARHAVRHA